MGEVPPVRVMEKFARFFLLGDEICGGVNLTISTMFKVKNNNLRILNID